MPLAEQKGARARNRKEHRAKLRDDDKTRLDSVREKEEGRHLLGQSRGGSGGVLGRPAAPEWAITTLAMTIYWYKLLPVLLLLDYFLVLFVFCFLF